MPSSLRDGDVAVVGAGHNALVAAAYLAQAGYRVSVFERRNVAGGAVSTVEQIPGYQFDLGGSAHILIRLTPIVEELQLERYGLEYIELDPMFYAPYADGDSVFFYRDADQTAHAFETKFPGQGEAYRRFLNDWQPFATAVRDAFLEQPGPLQLARSFMRHRGGLPWSDALPRLLRPYGEVLEDYLTEEKIKAPMVWMAAQSGPPPTEPLSAPFLLWHPLYHEGGVARPRGGSGKLSEALVSHIRDHGGQVHTGVAVDEILVERGGAVGLRSGADVFTARAVLSGTHARETFSRLLPREHRPARAQRMRVGNGFGAVLRLALDEPVVYAASEDRDTRIALQLLCSGRDQILHAYGDYLRGEPSSHPPLVAMTFTAVDESLAPPGGEVLWLWAQYFPYQLSRGDWTSRAPAVEETILDAFERYAPGTRDKIVGSLFQHPEWLERELGLYRGNVMHLEMSIDQMFGFRPFAGAAHYRSPLRGLYLTGASTHPGGGIMGASGRNAARVLLRDLERRKV